MAEKVKKSNRPYVLFNAAMTIDGKIASKSGDVELSDDEDWHEVHLLREKYDAIMVGINTILKDDPKLSIKFNVHPKKYPFRIVIDSLCRTPEKSNVISHLINIYPTIIATTAKSSVMDRKRLEQKGANIVIAGNGPQVDLIALMNILYETKGIKTILLEGGATLAWGMIENDLIDEIRLFISPHICGGKDATSLVMGKGFEKIQNSARFNLKNLRQRENYVILEYIHI